MSTCIEQHSYKNNQFSDYCENIDHSSICPTLDNFNFRSKKKIKLWTSRYRQRKALANLDHRMLTDIGFTYQQAKEEFSKPFWM